MSLIALEERYAWRPAGADNVVATWLRSNNEVTYQRLYDRGPLRLEQMADNQAGAEFLASYPMDDDVRRKVSSQKAVRLFGLRIAEVRAV